MLLSKYALLIIDMQQGLFHGPVSPYSANQVLSNICLLIEKARQAQVPVFFARHTGPDNSPFAEQSPLTQLIHEINVNAEWDILFVKKHPSCFRDTGLQLQLSQRGVKELVIAGMKTEFCVDTTCRAAPELGFRTVLMKLQTHFHYGIRRFSESAALIISARKDSIALTSARGVSFIG